MNCEECVYYVYDDEDEEYYCSVDMDQREVHPAKPDFEWADRCVTTAFWS